MGERKKFHLPKPIQFRQVLNLCSHLQIHRLPTPYPQIKPWSDTSQSREGDTIESVPVHPQPGQDTRTLFGLSRWFPFDGQESIIAGNSYSDCPLAICNKISLCIMEWNTHGSPLLTFQQIFSFDFHSHNTCSNVFWNRFPETWRPPFSICSLQMIGDQDGCYRCHMPVDQ